jgi:hypothetical protein
MKAPMSSKGIDNSSACHDDVLGWKIDLPEDGMEVDK